MKPDTEALLDLMIARAIQGLDDEDRDRLDQYLLETDPGQIEELERQLEAALAVAGNASVLESLVLDSGGAAHAGERDNTLVAERPSEALVSALEADADQFFGTAATATKERADVGVSSTVTPLNGGRAGASRRTDDPRDEGSRSLSSGRSAPALFGWTGWAVAALLLVTIWVGRPDTTAGPATSPTVAEARDTLLGLEGTVLTPWGDSTWADFAEVRGDVVWNDDRQEGYLLLSNMPSNDPADAQYQLWIVDPARDEEPVDGGVFDVPPGAREVIVPIRAKLAVQSPAAFAITREQPGGVVVSEGPLLVVASRG